MGREQIGNYDEELEKIDIIGMTYELLRALKKFFPAVVLFTALCGAVSGFWVWKTYDPVYEAYTSFVVQGSNAYNSSYYDNATAEQLEKTFPYIVTSGVLRDVVAKNIGVPEVTSSIEAEVMSGTNLFTIRVRDESPKQAYDVLQSVIINYPQVAEYIIGATSLTVVDESGVPTVPVNKKRIRETTAAGALGGFAVSVVILMFYAIRRKTIRQADDMKNITNAKFLGNIPETRLKKRSNLKRRTMTIDNIKVPSGFKEAVRLIRSRLEKDLKRNDCSVILVTSSIPGEGKTTVAVNLALAFARKDARVVLIDGDLRNPSVCQALDMEKRKEGVIHVLQGKVSLNSALIEYKNTEMRVLQGVNSVSNPTSLIRSDQMKNLVGKLKEDADYIVIDTPPSGILSDVAAYADIADCAVMVVRQDFTGTHQVQKGIETLVDANIRLAGYVLNYVKEGTMGYGYSSYGYRRYGYGKSGYGYGQTEEKTLDN